MARRGTTRRLLTAAYGRDGEHRCDEGRWARRHHNHNRWGPDAGAGAPEFSEAGLAVEMGLGGGWGHGTSSHVLLFWRSGPFLFKLMMCLDLVAKS